MKQNENLKGKIALVTGGNAGIGLETARGLAKQGATTLVLCRSEKNGQKAVADIKKSTGNPNVDYAIIDLSSQKSIRACAAKLASAYPVIDILVNNAGAFFTEMVKTEDGIERQFAINHIGHFLLTNLLLENIKAAAQGRIVIVSSNMHYEGVVNFDDLNGETKYDGIKAYGQSKMANVLFMRSLAQRLAGTNVTVNALHPGVVRTNIGNKNSSGFAKIGWILMKPFMVTTEKGAACSIFAASDPSLANVSGKYFVKCKEKWPSRKAQVDETAERLWQVSAKLCGLN